MLHCSKPRTAHMHDLTRKSCRGQPSRFYATSYCVFAITCILLVTTTSGKDIRVGGDIGWTQTASFADVEAFVGDRLVSRPGLCKSNKASLWMSIQLECKFTSGVALLQLFDWEGDQQNVVALRKRSCVLAEDGVDFASTTDSPAYVSLNYTGTFFFSSSLPDHCSAGQLFAVSVTPHNETAGKQPHHLNTGVMTNYLSACTRCAVHSFSCQHQHH